jgi:membrane-associated protease RseP (regulator of RpoE activity)
MAESIRSVPSAFDVRPRSSLNPTAREWRIHISLFALTVITTVFAGILLAAPDLAVADPPLVTPLDYLKYIPVSYVTSIIALIKYAFSHPELIADGATFSTSLLAILFAHEMGHYLACRYYGVNATLPFFIPAPLFFPGTFGAFIKIKSVIPSRRALFDIGLAGPLAGFVIAFPLSIIGLLSVGPPKQVQGSQLYFNDPILFRLLAPVLGVRLDPNSPSDPYLMAAWVGLLVTSLNLMPVGQLDGGHGMLAVFGQRAHRVVGRVAFVCMAILAVLGFWLHHSPSGFIYAVLLGVMLRVPHPLPPVMEPLGTNRMLIAIVTLIVFILCFWPFPITIT